MHAWLLNLPGINAVVHTHPTACLADLCQPEIPRWIEDRIFPDEVVCCGQKSVWVPYTDPGLLLAEAVARQTQIFMEREGHVPRIIALQNHGIIALGSGLSQAESAARMLCKAVRARQISGGSYLPLSKLDVERIARRPDEHYRQQLIWGTELLPSASNEGRTTGQNQQ
jgi:rhamnose utilization protein RhaD (predicted bifunctional aldolase and dehydrogenase)